MKKTMLFLLALALLVIATPALAGFTLWQIGDVEEVDPDTGKILTDYKDEFNYVGPGVLPPFADPFIVGETLDKEFPFNSNVNKNYATDFKVRWYGALPCGGQLTISWSPGGSAKETKIVTETDSGETDTFIEWGHFDPLGWQNKPRVESILDLGPLPLGWHEFRFQHLTGDGTWWDWVRLDTYICVVEIDVKPGSYPNPINLGSHGLIPVAILSSEDFDATNVDPDTIELAGSGVAIRGKSNKYMAHEEDVNGDGLVDLVAQVATANFDPDSLQDGLAILTGQTYDGQPIEGSDEVTIVP